MAELLVTWMLLLRPKEAVSLLVRDIIRDAMPDGLCRNHYHGHGSKVFESVN
jgi:hypothetical protein